MFILSTGMKQVYVTYKRYAGLENREKQTTVFRRAALLDVELRKRL